MQYTYWMQGTSFLPDPWMDWLESYEINITQWYTPLIDDIIKQYTITLTIESATGHLVQLATIRLVVSNTASIQADIENRALHTLIPCCWTLKNISGPESPLIEYNDYDKYIPGPASPFTGSTCDMADKYFIYWSNLTRPSSRRLAPRDHVKAWMKYASRRSILIISFSSNNDVSMLLSWVT